MRTTIDQATFDEWCDVLDAFLAGEGVATRSEHFLQSALLYGYVTEMSPEIFVKDGWDQDVKELEGWTSDVNLLTLRGLPSDNAMAEVGLPDPAGITSQPHYNNCPVCGHSSWLRGEVFAQHYLKFKSDKDSLFSFGHPVQAYACTHCGHISLSCYEIISPLKN